MYIDDGLLWVFLALFLFFCILTIRNVRKLRKDVRDSLREFKTILEVKKEPQYAYTMPVQQPDLHNEIMYAIKEVECYLHEYSNLLVDRLHQLTVITDELLSVSEDNSAEIKHRFDRLIREVIDLVDETISLQAPQGGNETARSRAAREMWKRRKQKKIEMKGDDDN